MDDKPRPKVELRDGKLFVESEEQPYVQGMIRHLRMSATELFLHRSIFHDVDKGIAHASHSIGGKAQLNKDALSVIGDEGTRSQELALWLKPWTKDEPRRVDTDGEAPNKDERNKSKYGHWRGVLGFLDYDWEIGTPAEWFVEAYLPPPVFDELASACRKGSLSTLSLSFDSDLWVRDFDRHTPPSGDVAWYVAPSKYGAELGRLTLESFDWTEKPLVLRRSAWDHDVDDEEGEAASTVEADPSQRKKVEEAQLETAKRIRKALNFIGVMLALVAFVLMLK